MLTLLFSKLGEHQGNGCNFLWDALAYKTLWLSPFSPEICPLLLPVPPGSSPQTRQWLSNKCKNWEQSSSSIFYHLMSFIHSAKLFKMVSCSTLLLNEFAMNPALGSFNLWRDVHILKYNKKWRVMKVPWDMWGWWVGGRLWKSEEVEMNQMGGHGRLPGGGGIWSIWACKHGYPGREARPLLWVQRVSVWQSRINGRTQVWIPLQWCLAIRWWVSLHQIIQANKSYEVFMTCSTSESDEGSFLEELTIVTTSPGQPKLLSL